MATRGGSLASVEERLIIMVKKNQVLRETLNVSFYLKSSFIKLLKKNFRFKNNCQYRKFFFFFEIQINLRTVLDSPLGDKRGLEPHIHFLYSLLQG